MQKITFEDLPSTNSPINATNLNQLQTNVESAIPTKTTLWTNSNPTSSFGSQSITLSNNNYDELEIYYKEVASGSYLFSQKIEKGYGTRLFMCFAPSDVKGAIYTRTMTINSETRYTFEDANYFYSSTQQQGTNNNLIVPIKIVGIKY